MIPKSATMSGGESASQETDYKSEYYDLVERVRSLDILKLKPLTWKRRAKGDNFTYKASVGLIDFTILEKPMGNCTMSYAGFREEFSSLRAAQKAAETYVLAKTLNLFSIDLEVVENLEDQFKLSI